MLQGYVHEVPTYTGAQLEMRLEVLGHPLSNAKLGGNILGKGQMI
jgi:hypothetical protein